MTGPTRPILRYHGGKWELAPWIIAHLPPHHVYVEPFGGAASVLLQKARSYAEIYNDLDGEIVNLFRVLRDEPERLAKAVVYTPFSRNEYREAFGEIEDPVELARRTLIRSHMGHAGAGTHGRCTGFRSASQRSHSHPAAQWSNLPLHLESIVQRLRGVVIENRDYLEVIDQQDGAETVFYVDPPYIKASRDAGNDYRHELTDEQHESLASRLVTVQGMVVLSGYHSSLYDRLYGGWERVEVDALAEGAAKRVEVLWMNEAAKTQLDGAQGNLPFVGGAA